MSYQQESGQDGVAATSHEESPPLSQTTDTPWRLGWTIEKILGMSLSISILTFQSKFSIREIDLTP